MSKHQNPISNLLSSVGNLLIRLAGNETDDLQKYEHLKLGPPKLPDVPDEVWHTARTKEDEEELELLKRWSQRLAKSVSLFDLELGTALGQRGEYLHVGAAHDGTQFMLQELYNDFNQIAALFNSATQKANIQRVRVSVSELETTGASKGRRQPGDIIPYFRLTTVTRQLLVEGKPGKIHFYMAPSSMALNFPEARAKERRKLSIRLATLESGSAWTVYGLPVSRQDVRYLIKVVFRDLVLLSAMDAVAKESGNTLEHVENLARVSNDRGFRDALSLSSEPAEDLVRDLLFAQQNTVHKLLNQQEETQAAIARDLHDSVLSDILMLRRRISSEDSIESDEVAVVLDSLTEQIRDICSGLVPRDLKDWGLETVIQDLMDKIAERTEADCSFEVEGTIPDLPSTVQLHVFRIVQECLNNIEKYANAKNILVEIKSADNLLTFKIADDGTGFDTTEKRERDTGGFGLPGIEERVELIKAFYKTRCKIDSKPGQGTTVLLELQIVLL